MDLKEHIEQYKKDNEWLVFELYYVSDYADSSKYVSDWVSEVADSNIDIYTGKLLDWVAEDLIRYQYVEQAIGEGIAPTDDFIKMLTGGQFLYYSEFIREHIEDYLIYYALLYLDGLDIKSQNIDSIVDELYNLDYKDFEKFSEIEEAIDEIISNYESEDE